MSRALIALGSNAPAARPRLDAAVAELRRAADVRLLAVSAWRETSPAGGPPGQDAFLNGAALLQTELPPAALLTRLHEIEQHLGRVRSVRWGPREIDLDLLLYEERVESSAELILPHPRMAFRRFVLAPAAEIAPEMRHPPTGCTLAELLAWFETAPELVAVDDPTGALSEIFAAAARRPELTERERAALLRPLPADRAVSLRARLLVEARPGGVRAPPRLGTGPPPRLALDPADPAWAEEELAAALAAMR